MHMQYLIEKGEVNFQNAGLAYGQYVSPMRLSSHAARKAAWGLRVGGGVILGGDDGAIKVKRRCLLRLGH